MAALRICVDARVIDGQLGGVQQVAIGLASGFSQLKDGDEEYFFLVYTQQDEWIRPYLQEPCRLFCVPLPRLPRWKKLLKARPMVRKIWHRFSPLIGSRGVSIPRSDGTIERAGVAVMHFSNQNGFLTEVPSIYHPHDLQHFHLPQFFSPRERRVRDVYYRTLCAQARIVVMMSSFGKKDIIMQYGLPENKVQVVPGAPVLTAYPTPSEHDLVAMRKKYSLPDSFIFYPAQTWEHKNHLGLLQALYILRQDGLRVSLVCSGYRNEFYKEIERRAQGFHLTDQVQFLGFVSPLELRSLYELCRCMIFPSMFEGWGMPIMEAFWAGVPVGCSNVTSLPELAGDAALLFDPYKSEEIARAIYRLWTDGILRQLLVDRGKKRVACFTWERVARIFRAHYRRLGGRVLNTEDRELIRYSLPSDGDYIWNAF